MTWLLLLLSLFFQLWLLVEAVPKLKQVHVITRHGARTPLPKNGDTLLELAGSTLTPTGQKQLYDVGMWLRQVYNVDNFLEFYDPSEVRLESSHLDRTLSSASALSLGLFPFNAQAGNHGADLYQSLLPEMPGLPIYSMRESNDIYLRSYHNQGCPTFHDRVQDLYESEQWAAIETKNEDLLSKLASLFPEDFDDGDNNDEIDTIQNGKIVLKHLWSYFDKINVARTECNPDPTVYACTSLAPGMSQLRDALNDVEFQELHNLMATTETMKYGVGVAGNLLGSQLLWRMLNRITDTDGKFFLYSAHVPTILGFLSTLKEWPQEESHPDYGSAIIMEVFQETDVTQEYSIRFVYKAPSKSTGTYITLTNANCEMAFTGETPPSTGGFDDEQAHCRLADFVVWATENTLERPEDWCDACGNESADVCLQARVNQSPTKQALEDLDEAFEDDEGKAVLIAGTFFGGLFAGLIIMGAGCSLCGKGSATFDKEKRLDSSNGIDEETQGEVVASGQHPSGGEVEMAPPAINAEIN